MKGSQQLHIIGKSDLLTKAKEFLNSGHRLVLITCSKDPAGKEKAQKFELSYSFDKDYDMTTLRIDLAPGEDLPSITPVYDGAYLYENEIHDLFGIKINGINVDFKGTFYKVAIPTPFNPALGGE
jgi:ech hydrogenase subunit D